MKTPYLKNLIVVLFLALVCVACNKHKEEEKEEDCNNVVVKDGKLLSPKWMVNFMDSLENVDVWVVMSVSGKELFWDIRKNWHFTYLVESYEYQQQTHIYIGELAHVGHLITYTCSGDNLGRSYKQEWLEPHGRTRQGLFRAIFCNHDEMCWAKRMIFEHYDRNIDHAVEDNSIYDCRNDFIISEGKLLSPQWMVNALKELENKAVEFNENASYSVFYQEVRKQRYVYIRRPGFMNPTVIYTCSGNKVGKDSELYGGGFVNWIGVNVRSLFAANFCYALECEEKKSEIIN